MSFSLTESCTEGLGAGASARSSEKGADALRIIIIVDDDSGANVEDSSLGAGANPSSSNASSGANAGAIVILSGGSTGAREVLSVGFVANFLAEGGMEQIEAVEESSVLVYETSGPLGEGIGVNSRACI